MIDYVRCAVGIAALVVITLVVLRAAGVGHRRDVLIASARAIIQLGVVALALRGVFQAPPTAIAVVTLMFGVATWTSSRRLRDHGAVLPQVMIACGAGAIVTIGIIVGLPALTRDLRTLVAVSGIVLGGTMTAATLTGRKLSSGLQSRRDEVEAWLSLGATPRQAVRDIARESVFEALVPALDQTRTVGLVTLPGAFVGALLGGANPAMAAQFQVVVLIGLLCAESITSALLAYLLGNPQTLPAPPHTL